MGFFSFLTSDTEDSISNAYSERGAKTVYLLQPNGEEPVREDSYEGYGVFGGTDVFVWLATRNLAKDTVASMSKEMLRDAGVRLSFAKIYIHAPSGQKWSFFHGHHEDAALVEDCRNFDGLHTDIIPEYGKTANELIEDADFQVVLFAENLKFPLKLSFDKDADYHSLPPAKNDPEQGYFY
jgi:hypothetical protein